MAAVLVFLLSRSLGRRRLDSPFERVTRNTL
jgi:hypothetical protein